MSHLSRIIRSNHNEKQNAGFFRSSTLASLRGHIKYIAEMLLGRKGRREILKRIRNTMHDCIYDNFEISFVSEISSICILWNVIG